MYPEGKDARREFYPGIGVWKQELCLTINGCIVFARARDVIGGVLVFIPDRVVQDFIVEREIKNA